MDPRRRLGVWTLAGMLLVPPLVAASTAPAEPVRFVIGFHGLPRGLVPGETFAGADVVSVNRVLHFAVVETVAPDAFAARAAADPAVRYVESDAERDWVKLVPSDPKWADQYGPQQVRADLAWDTTLGGPERTVCIVDTGVRYTHEDLRGSRWLGGYDFINDDADPNDDQGHGTHVAGIAAGGVDNGIGTAGVANVGFYGVKVLSSTGSGPTSAVANGIQWCADQGVDVISLSLGSSAGATVLKDSVSYAWGRGALVVAAAGNDGPCSNCISYPARYAESMAVTCTDRTKAQCRFSSDGPQSTITAPGSFVLAPYYRADNDYASLSGTSMSTPHVSGVATLLWSLAPDLTNQEVKSLLKDTAADLGPAGWDEQFGYGLVDAKAGLERILANPRPKETPIFTETFDDGVADAFTLTGLWRVSDACVTAHSAPKYLGYHRADACNYQVVAPRTAGAATFTVDLTGKDVANLRFHSRWEIEADQSGAYDVMRVQASTDGGASWTTLAQKDSRDGNLLNWAPQRVSLASYVGSPVALRFHFDSVDDAFNAKPGWFLDNVTVTAATNLVPVAVGGPDVTVSDADATGDETVTLDGTPSYDPDGRIRSIEWLEGTAVLATAGKMTRAFTVGRHDLTLRVTDAFRGVGTDQVIVTVRENAAPSADAGPDFRVRDYYAVGHADARLDATRSSDPDGRLVGYAWYEDGVKTATGARPTVRLADGEHAVTLEVTDNGRKTATDDVVVTVLRNHAPVPTFSGSCAEYVCSVAGSATDEDGDVFNLSWDFGDATPRPAGGAAVHTFARAGTYDACLLAEDGYLEDRACERYTLLVTAAEDVAGDAIAPVGTAPPALDVRTLRAETFANRSTRFILTLEDLASITPGASDTATGRTWRVEWTGPTGVDFVQLDAGLASHSCAYGTIVEGVYQPTDAAPCAFELGRGGTISLTFPEDVAVARGYGPTETLTDLKASTSQYFGSPPELPLAAGVTRVADETGEVDYEFATPEA